MKRSFIKIDRERFPQARHACLEPGACSAVPPEWGVGKVARRRTISLRIYEAKLHSSRSALSLHLSLLVSAVGNRKCC